MPGALERTPSGRDIGSDIRQRMFPSLAIALPVLVIELAIAIALGLLVALLRGSYLDRWVTLGCIAGMSVSSLFVIIAGQYLIAKEEPPIPAIEKGVEAALRCYLNSSIVPKIVPIIEDLQCFSARTFIRMVTRIMQILVASGKPTTGERQETGIFF